MERIRFWGGMIVGIVLALFALQNLQSTQLRILFWYADVPVVVIVILSAAIGAIWASLWIATTRWRKQRQSEKSADAEDTTLI